MIFLFLFPEMAKGPISNVYITGGSSSNGARYPARWEACSFSALQPTNMTKKMLLQSSIILFTTDLFPTCTLQSSSPQWWLHRRHHGLQLEWLSLQWVSRGDSSVLHGGWWRWGWVWWERRRRLTCPRLAAPTSTVPQATLTVGI